MPDVMNTNLGNDFTDEYHPGIDKVTERELVYDILTRLNLGKPFKNSDYTSVNNNDETEEIFPIGFRLKGGVKDVEPIDLDDEYHGLDRNQDGILMNIIRTLDTTHIENLDTIVTRYGKVSKGDTEVIIEYAREETHFLYKIIQESTGQDVTRSFDATIYDAEDENGDHYSYKRKVFDVPAEHDDVYKAFFRKR